MAAAEQKYQEADLEEKLRQLEDAKQRQVIMEDNTAFSGTFFSSYLINHHIESPEMQRIFLFFLYLAFKSNF